MDDFGGWSMQYAAEPCLPVPSRPSDDDDGLLGAFLAGDGFDLRSDHDGPNLHHPIHASSHPVQNLIMPPCHGGATSLPLPVSDGFMVGLDTADILASVTGALDDGGGGLLELDTFAAYGCSAPDVVVVNPEEPAASNHAAFSGYSSNYGGGNISSGESNTCGGGGGGGGGHDTEVASSPPCALARSPLPPATAAAAMAASTSKRKEAQVAAQRRGRKRDPATTTSSSSTSITFAAGHGGGRAAGGPSSSAGGGGEYDDEPPADSEAIAQVKEMIYRAAAMRPVHQLVCGGGDTAAAEPPAACQQRNKPRRRNVRISSDPQTVAARLRRERVSERLRVLQRLVPGGSRMDTASMLDEAASYLRFLKSQVRAMERGNNPSTSSIVNGGGGYGYGYGYHNNGSFLPPQSYLGGGTSSASASTVLAFGRDDGAKYNRDMQL